MQYHYTFISLVSKRHKQQLEQGRTCLSRMSFLANARPHSLLVVSLPPTWKNNNTKWKTVSLHAFLEGTKAP